MTNLYTDFDTDQKKRINDFFTQNIKVSDIKNEVDKIIWRNYDFPENFPDKLNDTVDLIIKHCEKRGLFITSHEVKDLLEKYSLKKNDVDYFIKVLNSLFIDEMTAIIPNNILSLCEGVEDFNFGDAIKCIPSSQIKEQINQIYANEDWWSNSVLKFLPSTNYSFSIKIEKCTKKSAHILAYKYLNIALSLLKIFSSYINTFYEKSHDVTIDGSTLNCSGYSLYNERDLEHNASLPRFHQSRGMICYTDGVRSMSDDLSSSYRILPNTKAELQKLKFNETCNDVFFGNKPIFQEIKRALDFMTRARVESDFNMKFVFLISSLESFIPNKSEKNGVTRKLMQLVSAIIKLNNQDTKKVIRRFNKLRCNIIHSSKNYVSTTEYKLLKDITEEVCFFYIQNSSSHETIESVFESISDKPLAR